MRHAIWLLLAACGRTAEPPAPPPPPRVVSSPADAAPRLRKSDLRLAVTSDPQGITFRVEGFENHGALGDSAEFLACVTNTFESATLPPITTAGRLSITYPNTFAPDPLSDKDVPIVDRAERAATEGRYAAALADVEHGLTLTSLDGPYRRRLIEVGGLAACRLGNEVRARYYFSLASSEIEDRLLVACPAIDFLE